MFKWLLFVFLFCAGICSSAQTDEALKAHVPKGYKMLFHYEADLNRDSIKDQLMILGFDHSLGDSVLKKLFPGNKNYQQRILIILLGQDDYIHYTEAGRNDKAIVQNLGGQDPFSNILCTPGIFTIQHVIADGTQKCTVSARFEWIPKQKDWYLTSYSHTCAAANVLPGSEGEVFKEKTPKNFGKLRFEKYKYPMDIEIDEWGQ
ncbi:MAG: hypothetical protein ACHQRM_09035 [Bacteroidia bacterium]